VSRDEINR